MNKQLISLLMIVLFVSLPFAVAQEREDLGEVININVNTYQPAVVPSNILAEQDVPVYAYLEGTTLGSLLLQNNAVNIPPLYKLPKISKINIAIKDPSNYVISVQAKPPYKKIYARDNNSVDLGYLIVRLRKIKKENEVPDVINVNLTAKINFELDEGFSIFGTQDLLLRESNDENNWKSTRTEESAFWNKKGYVRAYNIKSGKASFEVYDGSFDSLTTLNDKTSDFVSNSIRFKTGEFEDSNLLDDRFRLKVQRISVPEPKANLRIIDSSGKISDKTVTKGMSILEGSSYRVKEIRPRRPTDKGQLEEIIIQKGNDKQIYLRTLYQSTSTQATQINIQPIVNAVIDVESGGDSKAVSCTGPAGLMQLSIDAANDVRTSLGSESEYPKIQHYQLNGQGNPICSCSYSKDCRDESIDWRFNKDKNVKAGTQYLLKLINKYNKDLRLALLAYNAGPGSVDQVCQTPPTNIKEINFDYDSCKNTARFFINGKEKEIQVDKQYVQKIFNKLKEQTGIELDITKPVYLDQTTVTVSTETQVGSQNPCTNAKILSDKEIEETSSYIDLYCTAINELKSLIDNYPESPLISSSYELIADIYFNYLKNKLLARDNYELALLTANSLQKDSIEVKLKDLNKAIGESIEYGHALLDDEALEVSLLRVIPKEDNAEATLRIDSTTTNKKVNDPLFDGIGTDNKGNYRVHLIEIQSDFIRIIKTYSKEDNNGKENLPDPQRYTITLNNRLELVEDKSINKFRLIELLGTDTKEEAIVTILPGSGKETSTSDFSLHIPIEKRAIRFTPEEIDNKIARTKRLIDKLDSVISKLEKTLKVWKATCLITMAVLTVKNSFFNPIKNLARRTVMRGPDGQSGWNQICSDRLRTELDPKTGRPRFRTIDECIEANADEIEQEISNTENVIKRTETLVKSLGNIKETSSQAKLSELIGNDLSQEQIQRLNEIGRLGNDEARNLILLKNSNLDSPQQAEYNKKIEEYKKEADLEIGIQQKLQSTTYEGEDKLRLELSLRKSLPATIKARELYESTSDIVKNYITENNLEDKDFKPIFLVYPEENQPGNLTPQEQKFSTFYDEKKETNLKRLFIGNTQAALNGQEIYIQTDNRGNIINYYVSSGGVSDDSRCPKSLVYSGSPSVIYDDKGKPLIIPIQTPQLDSNYADYVIFGYDLDTKLPNQYSIFNVGLDQIISELNRNTSDDCVVENKESFDDKTQTSKIVSQAYNEALKGYQTVQEKGISSKVKILGKEYFVNYASNRVDELLNPQCTDVFSISDCHIMFGICDPVICPTSRFDFGNTWKVDNVVQTGIVGSVLLGIKNLAPYEPVPVCLTGVLAGLQNIKSILEGLNECLQTAKVKGEYVGICDAITSIYICETVWREGLALYRLKGKVINWMSKDILHQDPDGGEYLTFKNSLKNVEDSAKFLTKDYAQNTFKDYAGKSFDEVGSVICRQAIYSSTPGVGKFLDQVLQPESPPQFTAILNVYPWATLPDEKGRVTQEQSRYQIYYHVYAGNNKAIRYSVILKDPLGRQIYVTENPETVRRIRNSLEAGDYKDKTIDFVAASGYNEVCIEVDGIERCGFGSVTSAFSFNFLKDELVKNELSKPITNEEECTLTNSGLSSSILSLTNTQSKSSFGATYTGIIRECQLDNPGKGTNAQDWKKIPNSDCGKDERGRDLGYCWLYVNPEVLNLDYVQGNENLILNLTGLTKEQVITLDDEEKTKERIQTFSLDERFNELASLTCDDIEKNKKEIITKSNDFIRDSREVMSKSMATNIVDELQFNIAKVYIKLGGCDYLKVQETEAVKYSELITGISKVACTEEMTLELKQEKEFRDYKIRVASIYAPEIKGNKADPLDFDVEPFNPTSGIPQASEDKKYDYSKCNVEFDIMRNGKQIDCVPISSYQLFNLFRKALNVKGINKYSDCENLQIKLLQCNQDNVKLEIRTNELSNSDKNRIEKDIRDAIALENQNGDNIQINKISYVEGQSKILLELSGSISLSLRQKLDEIIQPCRQTLEISQAATDYEGEFQDTVDTIRADIRSMLSVFDLNAIKITINPITANEIRGSTLQLQTNEFLSEQLVLDIQEYLNRYGITLEILNANIICWEINKQNIISEEECHGENDENACFIKKDKKIFGLGFMKKSSCLPCQDSTTMEDLNNDKVRCNDRCKDIAPFHLYYSDRAKLCVV